MEEKDNDAPKITNQCRVKNGMSYDIKADGVRLTLLFSPRSNDGDENEWHVEARASRSPEAVVVGEWGPTRIEALRAVGRSWTSKSPTHNLAMFDWEAVAKVLLAVRAL